MRAWLIVVMLCFGLAAQADEVTICHNYDCAVTAKVNLRAYQLRAARRLLLRATDAAEERKAISLMMGLFEVAAGRQTPTWADKGRNVNDDGVDGRMDCIDEAANTTTYLRLVEGRGWLKYHRVVESVKRAPLLVNDHWAARIVEQKTGQEFAVDSWFFDNGQPAFVVPLNEWLAGAEPDEE
ncbi:MAG: hypothetical protein KJ958_14955 [Gammaproteobacteria bacterium]|nr:hypothetical protein [Gammaproteobacteria bacterium]MBU1980459.1 hypothetical protein [Gammaproteobacteria bacterium]